jgi:hypothetical protein
MTSKIDHNVPVNVINTGPNIRKAEGLRLIQELYTFKLQANPALALNYCWRSKLLSL